jgi:dipeptidyl aminopeptidase/acylaminoacyl peptidase
MAGESKTMYADPGHLLFRRESAVYAQAFDIGKLALTGDEPVRVADEVVANYPASGQGSFAVSPNGVLVYFFVKGELAPVLPLLIAGPAGGGGNFGFTEEWDRQLAWASRTAAPDENLGPFGKFRGVEISPDGKRIAVHRHDDSGGDIFVLEPKPREALTRITRDPSRDNSSPVWSPDGKRIVYTSFQKEKWGLYQTLSDGSGTEELLFESEALKAPMSWSPDGKSLVFWVQDPKTNGDLWVLAMDGERKATPLLNTPANETHAQISPDGKWIAYTSNSTGGRREIYVQPFPSGSGLWQISDKGGDWPRWNRSGKKELFYHALGDATNPDGGSGFSGFLFAVDTNVTGAAFEHGPPRQVLNTPVLNPPHPGGDFHVYDISPDGQRFLLYQVSVGNVATLINLINQLTGPDPPAGMVVALNWASPRKK